MQFNKQVKFVNTSGAPFTVNSSTVVSNLNADLLDGNDASAFALANHSHSYLPLSGGTITGPLTCSSTGSYRANLNLISASDVPNDLYFGSNGSQHWSITSRSSSEGNYLGFYSTSSNGGWAATVNYSTKVWNFTVNPTVEGNAVIHAGNYTSYCATASHNHNSLYLPFSGGTLTGTLTVSNSSAKVNVANTSYDTSISLYASQNVGIWNEKTSSWILKYDGSWLYRNDKKIWDEGSFNPSNYSLTSHNHDSTYLKLTGGTLENYGEILTLSNTAGGDSFLRFSRNGNTSWSIGVSSGNFYFKENVTNTNFVVFRESSQGLSADFAGQVKSTGFVKSGGTSSQFLKADGSVDSTIYWNAGNDGSGSGLDADLLDGLNSSDFFRYYGTEHGDADNGALGTGYGYGDPNHWATWGATMAFGIPSHHVQLQGYYYGSQLYARTKIGNTGEYSSWREIAFTDMNVASSTYATSAGNADTLDGQHGSYYATASHNHDGTYLKLDGSSIMTSNLNIKFADTDKFVVFSYTGEINPSTDSWRVGVLGTGSGETNYFTVQYQVVNSGSNTWKTAFNIGQSTGNVSFTNNISVAGYTNLHTGNHTALSNSEIDTIMV